MIKTSDRVKNILFRADSSSTIGTGHIMRDLVLAKQFKNNNIIFASRDLKGNINFKITKEGYKLEILEDNNIKTLQRVIEKHNIDMIVIDNYEIDYEFEKKLKEKYPNIELMVLDDTYEKHYCDILLNHNIYADESRYKNLVPQWCELRCGKKHTLIREEFYEAKRLPKIKNEKFTIFLAMGGADHKNIIMKVLNVLEEFDVNANIVTTSANKNLDELKNFCDNKNWVSLHINSKEIAKIMRGSDFAIVSASVILNEVFFMGIPFIAIKTADNQREMVKFLKDNGYPILEEFSNDGLKDYLKTELKVII